MFVEDFVLNGRGHGEVGSHMGSINYDTGLQRPYFLRTGPHGKLRECLTVNQGTKWDKEKKEMVPHQIVVLRSQAESRGLPVLNATTTLRKDEWLMLDDRVIKAARARLRAWDDLRASSTFTLNGMSKKILEWETQSDPMEAIQDMDSLTEGRADSPLYQLEGVPLPITHSSFMYSSRDLAVSRNGNTPLDTTSAEAAGRRVGEKIEKILIGIDTGITYGVTADYGDTPTAYGYTNHPQRSTKTDVTTPTTSNHATTVQEVLEMVQTLANQNFFGPFMLYHSTDWDEFMDDDYVAAAPQNTLRERLRKISQITDVRRLDFLTSTFTLLFVQMTSDVARAINGMDITTVQWETKGGMQQNFKVMAIQVAQLRADFTGQSGIMHGTIA